MSQLNFRDEKNHGSFSHAENIGWLCWFVNLESIQNMPRKTEMKRDHLTASRVMISRVVHWLSNAKDWVQHIPESRRHIDMTEVEAMRYVSSIHVPKVQHVWRWDGVTYITMDVVDGERVVLRLA